MQKPLDRMGNKGGKPEDDYEAMLMALTASFNPNVLGETNALFMAMKPRTLGADWKGAPLSKENETIAICGKSAKA